MNSTDVSSNITNTTSPEGFAHPSFCCREKKQVNQDISSEVLYIVLVVLVVEPFRDLKEYYQSSCTGTLIRNDIVLTTASCTEVSAEIRPNPRNIKVYMRNGFWLRALRIIHHPLFKTFDAYDLALIYVDQSRINNTPKLHGGIWDFQRLRNSCFIGGYGKKEDLTQSNFQVVWMNEVDVEELACVKKENTPDRICLRFKSTIPCRGDVGSPLICNGVLLAIYTPVYKNTEFVCTDRYGVIFTSVMPVGKWLDQVLSKPEIDLEWLNSPFYVLLLCVVVVIIIASIYCGLVELMHRLSHHLGDTGEETTVQPPPTYTPEQQRWST